MQYCADYGLLVLRVGLGIIYLIHGSLKIQGGKQAWLWLGSQMSVVGISCCPLFWGILAILAEVSGGLLLLVGFKTRFAACMIMGVMTIAILMHLSKKSEWSVLAHPLSLWIVMLSLMISGGGKYSVDFLLSAIMC